MSKCIQCGKGNPGPDGRCPVCGGPTAATGLWTETEGMAAFNARVEQQVQVCKEAGQKCISVELDYLSSDEYHVLAGLFRRVAAIAGVDYDAASDHYWVIQCWMELDEAEGNAE